MALSPGTRLGPYEIVSALGAGGMGEVYRAHDTKLNRDVAIKVLLANVASDPDRLARFGREAQVLASLNHPNIAHIHGLEEADGVTALILELVEGEDLAQRLARGPIPIDDALPIARQIAEALEAAHEQGIIHRDLKPANIKVRPDGTVKVLDFGLAKAMEQGSGIGEQGSGHLANSPTITSPAMMTGVGVILGTAAYMSPEQAKGRAADKRSDVWAFGCVLYEMLTGRRAFDGEDVADTLAFILTKEPEWTALPANTPPSIRKLLRRCLEKDRKHRLADSADAKLEIDDALIPGEATSNVSISAGGTSRRAYRWGIGGVLTGAALVGGAIAGWNAWQTPAPAQSIRFVVGPPESEVFAVAQPFLTISPDGRRLAFVTGKGRSANRLWIRSLDALTAQAVQDTNGAISPLWSPDGGSIVFSATLSPTGDLGRLRTVDVAGGPPVTLAEAGIPGAWSRDGTILFRGRDGRIYRIADKGGDAVPVTTLIAQETRHQPEFFLADQRRFVFQTRLAGRSEGVAYIGSLDSPARTQLLDNVATVAFAQGYVVFQRGRTLFGQRFDNESGRLSGEAVQIVENVDDVAFGRGSYAVSSNGVLAYRNAVRTDSSRLTWFSLDGTGLNSLALQGSYDIARRPNLSPDGRHLAVTRVEAQGRSDVWLIDLERDLSTRFTFDSASDSPIWSADGSRIVFTSRRKGVGDLYQRNMRSAGTDELLLESPEPKQAHALSPDGKFLLFGQGPAGNPEIWALPLTGDRTPIPIVKTGYPAGYSAFSPDGRWFAYCEGNSDAGDQVYVQPFPPTGDRTQLSTTTGSAPQWSADGKTVVYSTVENRVMKVDVAVEGSTLRAGAPQDLFAAPTSFIHRAVLFDSPRARVLLPVSRDEVAAPPITVIVHALEELKRVLSTK